VKDRIKFLAEF